MKKYIILSICLGLGLVGLFILKNIASLNNRMEEDEGRLKLYSTDNIELLLPERLVEESDTSYLEDGSIFIILKGVSGSIDSNGHHGTYTLSIADYSKQFTDSTSFRPDSMQTNLHRHLRSDSTFHLLYLRPIKFHGNNAVTYFGRRQQDFETCITFNIGNRVIGLVMSSPDSLDENQEKILQSIKVKNGP